MLAAFIDESYPEGRELFCLVAVVCTFDQYLDLSDRLTRVKKTAISDYGAAENAELHAHEIWHGKKAWQCLQERRRTPRGKIFRRVFTEISTSGARVIIEAVDNTAVHATSVRPTPGHVLAMSHLLETLDSYSAEEGTQVRLISDYVDRAMQQNQNLTAYKVHGTHGIVPSRLPRILEPIRYIDSEDQLGLQAADMIAFLWNRRQYEMRVNSYSSPPHQGIWGCLNPSIIRDHIWRP